MNENSSVDTLGKHTIEVIWKEGATVEQMAEAQGFIKEALDELDSHEGEAFPECMQAFKVSRA